MVLIKLGYNPKKKFRWEVLPKDFAEETHKGYQVVRFHQKLWEKVKNIMKIQMKGYDCVILIDGDRRTGKSTLAKAIAYLLNPKITISNYVAGLEEAPQKLDDAKVGDPLIFDEGSLLANSKDAMRKKNVQLEKIIDVIGVKRLVLIFCMPSFFGISRPIAVDHSRFLIHTYTDKELNRGKFLYFSTKKKKALFAIGKKSYHSYKKPKASFNGKFVDFKLSFEEEYNTLKSRSLKEALNPQLEKEREFSKLDQSKIKTNMLIQFKENCPDVTDKVLAKGFGISTREYYRRRALYKSVRGD